MWKSVSILKFWFLYKKNIRSKRHKWVWSPCNNLLLLRLKVNIYTIKRCIHHFVKNNVFHVQIWDEITNIGASCRSFGHLPEFHQPAHEWNHFLQGHSLVGGSVGNIDVSSLSLSSQLILRLLSSSFPDCQTWVCCLRLLQTSLYGIIRQWNWEGYSHVISWCFSYESSSSSSQQG